MALLNKIKSIFKKSEKPVKKALVGKPPTVKTPARKSHFGDTYKILKQPHISEKATSLNEENKYIFKVYSTANKVETEKAIESLYGVKVKDVNIINIPRKRKVFKGIKGFKPGYKKAIVTLEEGHKIEILPH